MDKIGIRELTGEPINLIPKLNRTKSSSYMDYFDRISHEKMSSFINYYCEDFKEFNYKRSLEEELLK